MSLDDYLDYAGEPTLEEFLKEELERIAKEAVFLYLTTNGDAIEERVRRCLMQARSMNDAGHYGAALVRAAAGMEAAIRFFLVRPLVQGAFLSDNWTQLLSRKILKGRAAEDRDILPAILRNWDIDITSVKLSNGSQAWEQIKKTVWPRRDEYLHKADDTSQEDAKLSIECLEVLLSEVVDPLARKLGFTREQTGCWSEVTVQNPPEFPDLNPPRKYSRSDPFLK